MAMLPSAFPRSWLDAARVGSIVAGAACCIGVSSWTLAQPSPAPSSQRVGMGSASAQSNWSELSPRQKSALAPLQGTWNTTAPDQRQKWLELAIRIPRMPEAEQVRVRERMTEWARLTPAQRGQARLQFQESRRLAPVDRKAKWEAYQTLPPDQRQELSKRATRPLPERSRSRGVAGSVSATAGNEQARQDYAPATLRSGLAPSSSEQPSAQPPARSPARPVPPVTVVPRQRAVAPTLVQARPGATTSLISKRQPPPPAHAKQGLSRLATSPGSVDAATLLPHKVPAAAVTTDTPEPPTPDYYK